MTKKTGGFADQFGVTPKQRSNIKPTEEQLQALELFNSGESFAVEAGAGTGKTSTLQLFAESTNRRGQYTAFNKSIVTEAGQKFPSNVAVNTSHSLAFRAVGRQFQSRLNSKRMRSSELAQRLSIHPMRFNVGGAPKNLNPGYLAGLVMRTVDTFCQSADPEPTARHFEYIDGIDLHTEEGKRGYDNNMMVREELLPVVRRAWADLCTKDGQLPFKHGHYLKMWQLSSPVIDADFILEDECQDVSPVVADIILQQMNRGVQVVLVGDSQQEIYGWMGAINSFGMFNMPDTTYLTQSFRFGDKVAAVANHILSGLDAPLRLKGLGTIASTVGATVGAPDAVLTRTNATAVRTVLGLQQAEQPVHLLGGGAQVLSFARAVNDLQMQGRTNHPELACFDTYEEVKQYVNEDPQGSDLRLMVDLVEEFGTQVIEEALSKTEGERPGVTTVSTAHACKGRQWGQVQLAPDFGPKQNKYGDEMPETKSEQRLLYVAVTRAQHNLDVTAVPQLKGVGY